ncbi:MAG: hypothetical protein HOO09_10960 [Rhodospirillaceae bacterium]|nr:hypothetical protein [Rhodospirillaceae bacterium]
MNKFTDFALSALTSAHTIGCQVAIFDEPMEGMDRDGLIEGLHAHGHTQVTGLFAPKHLAAVIDDIAGPGDLVVCLGAGNITAWAQALPEDLSKIRTNKSQDMAS